MQKILALAALATSMAAATPAIANAQVYVHVGPPRPIYERRPIAPGPGYAWQPGYHRWDGNRYVWVPGAYAVAPRPRAVWVPGHWVNSPRGYFWRDGHWG